MQTIDGAQINIDALYQICPSCFTESADKDGSIKHKVDFNKLRALLGDYAEENAPESYDFTWVGKRAAQRERGSALPFIFITLPTTNIQLPLLPRKHSAVFIFHPSSFNIKR